MAPLTGCVACQKVPETGMLPPTSTGVLLSIDASDANSVVWLEAVDAPEGSGKDAMLTGWVACQKVPVTAMVPGKVTSTFRLPELSTERACSRPSAPVPPTRIGLMPEVAVPSGKSPCTRGSPGTYALSTES